MKRAALERLARMQPGELRFRAISELRRSADRLRFAVSPPRWDRRRARRILKPNASGSMAWQQAFAALKAGDYLAAHVALGEYFTTRNSVFPFAARDRQALGEAIRRDFPTAAAEAVRRAENVLHGRYDLLGYRGLNLGTTPDWHADAVHRRHSPRVFWAKVPYLSPATGDHKVVWELNRHQHWITLGRAFVLTGQRRFYDEFTAQLGSWLENNPPLLGTNWASMLELAFRAFSWLWALEMFAPAAGAADREPWIVDLLIALERQLAHIEHNLSYYFSPNTHLSGEALALYVAGLSLPEMRGSGRRASVGRDVLIQEASRQVRSDGGHAELSAHYHRYSTDFYLLASIVAHRAGDRATAVLGEAAGRQARYLRTIADDNGVRPQLGDDDGGLMFPICGRLPEDCRDTLASASLLLHDPTLAIDAIPEESYWMCGVPADDKRRDSGPRTRWRSTPLPASGYFVSRTPRGDHLIFDAGPHGFLNGGHAHADALSLTLSIAGRPVLIDPGTATYTMDRERRDRFRSTRMHNTVSLDGRSQSEPRGAFHWKSTADAHAPIWRAASDCDYVEGTHQAYAPRRHTRGVLAIHGVGWWIVDHLLGTGSARADHSWHIHPAWEVDALGPNVCRLSASDRTLAIASSAPLTLLDPGTDPLAAWSPAYGVVEAAPAALGTIEGELPMTIGTFIPAAPEIAHGLEIERAAIDASPGRDWHAAAFRVRWQGGAMLLLSAVERTEYAHRDSAAPSERWGTPELRTDARLAAVIDRHTSMTETIVVNGTMVAVHQGQSLISLSQPMPLLRVSSSTLAPGVHEVVVE